MSYNNELKQFITGDLRMPLYGVAGIDKLESYIQPEIKSGTEGLRFVIVCVLELSTSITKTIIDQPTLIYKHHYAQLNYLLDRNALQISQWIMTKGFNALPIPASQVLDFGSQLGHFSHRHAAVEAGLGWIGKNNLLVTAEFGSHQRLITILTDIPLDTNGQIENGCGKCNLCITTCPADALTEDGYDYERCYNQLNKFRGIRGIGHHICGMCIKPCKGSKNS